MDGMIKAVPGITGIIQSGAESVPPYTGEYEVTPRVGEAIILQTKGKRATENIVVTKIPIAEVSNAAGGKTLTIGGTENG